MISFQKHKDAGLTYVQPVPRGLHVVLPKPVPFRDRLNDLFGSFAARAVSLLP
jgi:hypothetical protein